MRNAQIHYECTNKSMCNIGKNCGNRRISSCTGYLSNLTTFKTTFKGVGVKCNVDIKKREFIAEYTGEIVTVKDVQERHEVLKEEYGVGYRFYTFNINKDLLIDATFYGCITRFINHSCEPNCTAEL